MIARTTLGRPLAVVLSLSLSQLAVPAAQAAAPHVVDPQKVAARLAERAAAREAQVKLVEQALDATATRQQAGVMGLSVERLRAAVPHLSDNELQDLSQRAARVKDVTAGHHGSDDGLVILAVVLLLAGLAILVAAGGYDDSYYDDCGCY